LRERLPGRTLDRMISRLAALGAVVLAAATTLASTAQGAGEDVRMNVLSVTPQPPQAAQPFELVARVEFAPAPGSIFCRVWAGGQRYRNIRLTWESSIARCFFRVPADARGKRLTVGLVAAQGGSRARTTLSFTVS
jgi:predicted small secreted protein